MFKKINNIMKKTKNIPNNEELQKEFVSNLILKHIDNGIRTSNLITKKNILERKKKIFKYKFI